MGRTCYYPVYNLICHLVCLNEPISRRNGSERRLTGFSRAVRPPRAAKSCRAGAAPAERASPSRRNTVFPRRERLSRASFPTALSAGRRLSSANFTAVIPEKEKGYAVVVSKKTARLSSTRHRIKRRVLGALRTLALPKALILFPKSSVLPMDYQQMKTELAGLLSKIRQ